MAHPDLTDAPADVPSSNGRALPESVRIGTTPRISPNELRALKAETGQTLEALMSDPADAMQAMVWLRLRRDGYHATWDACGDVAADMTDESPDPTRVVSTTTLPLSADSGE